MNKPELTRRPSEIKGFLGEDGDYVGDSSSNFFPRQQSGFQDERSMTDLESPTSSGGETPMNLEYSIEGGLQSLEVTQEEYQRQGHLGCLAPGPKRRRRACMVIVTAVLFVIVLALAIALGTNEQKEKSSMGSLTGSGNEGSTGGSSNGGNGNQASGIYPTPTEDKEVKFSASPLPPLSTLDPVDDLNLYAYDRPQESSPSTLLDGLNRKAIPTNSWYQSILRLTAGEDPTNVHKAYLMPYVVDMAGDIPGVRIHVTRVLAEPSQVTLTIDEPYALTMGAMPKGASQGGSGLAKGYAVREFTELGITLEWDAYDMKSSLVQGSPYITMVYNGVDKNAKDSTVATAKQAATTVVPTLYSEVGVSDLTVDGSTVDVNEKCGSEDFTSTIKVEGEVDL